MIRWIASCFTMGLSAFQILPTNQSLGLPMDLSLNPDKGHGGSEYLKFMAQKTRETDQKTTWFWESRLRCSSHEGRPNI